VDGKTYGTTTGTEADRSMWCSDTWQVCYFASGIHFGEFSIPAGKHTIMNTSVKEYANGAFLLISSQSFESYP
jgi:hypothetical protein